MEYLVCRTVLLALIYGLCETSINLFETFDNEEGDERHLDGGGHYDEIGRKKASDKKYIPCEQHLLKEFKKLSGTGAKAYPISEESIQFCPNFCDNLTTVNTYCLSHEPVYVKAFAAEVKSDRCCDERQCQCVCHFRCKTFQYKEKEYRTEGYKNCVWDKTKYGVLKKAKKMCKIRRRQLQCKKKKMRLLCPQQFTCTAGKCLACVNANCVSRKDKKISKQLLVAQNETENQDAMKRNKKSTMTGTNKRKKVYRTFKKGDSNDTIQVGIVV